MSGGKGFSGKGGDALFGAADGSPSTKVVEVVKWTIDPTATVHKYNANTTGGHKRAVAGVRDTKGTLELKVSSVTGVQIGPGDECSLRLEVDDSGSNYITINHAVIAGAPLECDLDEGEIVSMTYAFEASDITGAGLLAALTNS
jgi:hypothetical protein